MAMTLSQTSRSEKTASRPSAGWFPAALIGMMGMVGLCWGLFDGGRTRTAEAQAALVLAQLNSAIGAVRGQSGAALLGDPLATPALAEAKGRITETWQLLERGGPLRRGDRTGVRALSQIKGVASGTLKASLENLNASLDTFQDNARGLDAAATILQQAPRWERALNEATTALRRQPTSEGVAAVAAVAADLSSSTSAQLAVLFPATGATSEAQEAWVERWSNHARQAQESSDRAQQTAGLSTPGKAAWRTWAEAVVRWADAARALGASQPYRVRAQAAWPGLAQSADQASASASAIQQALDTVRNRWLTSDFLAIGAAFLAIGGVLVWIRMGWQQTTQQWALSQDHRTAQESQEQIDHITHRLRRILSRDGEAVVGGRLEDDASSSTFTLTALINRVLESRDVLFSLSDEHLKIIESALVDVGMGWTSRLQGQWSLTSEALEGVHQGAGQVAVLSKAIHLALNKVGEVRQGAARGQGIIQEGLWHTDELRETMQANAKRLKRLGESSQSVRSAVEVVRDICRRIHVYATNAAIESAALGDTGRNLGALAAEIDRLAQHASQGVGSIDGDVRGMQGDIQDTMGAMEQNTSDLVKGSQASNRAAGHFREVDQLTLSALTEIGQIIQEAERLAVEQGRTHQRLSLGMEGQQEGLDQARRADLAVGRGQEELRGWRTELSDRQRRV